MTAATLIDTVDPFAGPGGWSVATAVLGLREVGIELDPWACATRADVAAMPTHRMAGKIRGLIASPPCGTFSAAGKGEGIGDMPLIHQCLDDLAAGRDTRAQLAAACSDPRTPLVVEPLRYALDLRPEWIALEQVPAVLPLWEHIARILRTRGYSTWVGILNAADFGVAQTRKRAILIASRLRTVAPPEPTHAQIAEPPSLFGPGRERWVSMAEALGWAGSLAAGVVNTRGDRRTQGGNEFSPAGPSWALTEKTRSWTLHTNRNQRPDGSRQTCDPAAAPAPTLTGKSGSQWVLRSGQSVDGEGRAERGLDEPAVSITGRADLCAWSLRNNTQANSARLRLAESAGTLFFGARGNDVSWIAPDADPIRIAIEEAAVLQSFPADYPWQGTKTQKFLQCGNAVPPLLALHVLSAATGIAIAERIGGVAA